MDLQFLGTGGSQPIPLPTCDCELCREARRENAPYTRYGYSIYLHDIAGLIDASEFAPINLSRWGIPRVESLFLTHWHADHSYGVRALGMRDPPERDGETFLDAKRRTAPTLVTTRAVYDRACESLGLLEQYVEQLEIVDCHFVDEEPFEQAGIRVEPLPYPLTEDGPREATGFLFRAADTTLAVVADDARYFDESQLPDDLDAAVFECGSFTHGPDGERIADEDVLPDDLAHEEVVEMVERADPERAFLSHIGHQYRRSYDDFRALEAAYDRIRFAHDGLRVDL